MTIGEMQETGSLELGGHLDCGGGKESPGQFWLLQFHGKCFYFL